MKTVLITGASAGIGKETAKEMLKAGYRVYVAARRVERMRDLEELGATAIKLDITKEEEIVSAIQQISERDGGVDILVNNAGFGLYGAVEDTTIDEARYQFEVNLFGLARLTQEVLPYMRKQAKGKIINVSSMGGKIYFPLGAWYHATKHALEGWSDCLRLEVKPFGIDVVIIQPGAIRTEFGDTMTPAMLERSKDSPYQPLAETLAKATEDTYAKPSSSTPALVIAKLITKAAKAKRPKTRYAAGAFAKPMLFLRRWLSDRNFDRLVMSTIK